MKPSLVLLISTIALAASGSLVEIHSPSVIPNGWVRIEEQVPPRSMFRVTIGVKRGNMKKIRQVLNAVSDPESDQYLQYPTFEEIGEWSRPSPEHTRILKRWLAESHVTSVQTHPHGDYVGFEASAHQLEKMANGKFVAYTNSEGRVIYRITSGIRVPGKVADSIDTFTGFHGFPLFATTPKIKDGSVGNVNPGVFRQNYQVTEVPPSGKVNIQAIAQFQGQYVKDSDLADFCVRYDGGVECQITKYVGKNINQPGLESMLDTEYITSLGQQQTWVYSFPNFDFCSDLTAFGSNVTGSVVHPYTISISYGSQKIDFCSASVISRVNDDVTKMGTMGITVMIASGDDGSGGETMQGSNGGRLSPSFPASVQHAVAVGSTYWVAGLSGEEEATTSFGSGGGFSYDFPAPLYQKELIEVYLSIVPLPALGFAVGGRGSPDVSTLGESFTILVNGVSIAVGGTSASSPSFAALVTLLNEICLLEANRPLGFANPLFYKNPEMFTDIIKGTNAIGDNSRAGWDCTSGWDAATGLGVPNFPVMVAVVQQACKGMNK